MSDEVNSATILGGVLFKSKSKSEFVVFDVLFDIADSNIKKKLRR